MAGGSPMPKERIEEASNDHERAFLFIYKINLVNQVFLMDLTCFTRGALYGTNAQVKPHPHRRGNGRSRRFPRAAKWTLAARNPSS
jgi:hypothetical protein